MSTFPPPQPPQQEPFYYSSAPQAPQPQQGGSGCVKLGAAGCIGGFASLARARADQRVIEDLGTPIKPGLFVSGTIKGGLNGSVDLNYSLSGPKSDGSMHVVAVRDRGVWTYKTMLVHTSKRDIDLLSP